jgi:glycosyltransferase involved in cell wall biosynthesis
MSKGKKKKILFHSNHSRAKTGFGKHMKHLITYLYKTKKYDIVEFANGRQWNDPALNNMPWRTIGSLPFEPSIIQELNSDQQKGRMASYGHAKIDDVIKQEKPDIYLGIEDIWGMEGFWNKNWWKKINSLIWTPIDSIPLLDKHIDAAKNTSNFIVQASFAKKELENNGIENVHLFPVPIDENNFFKIDQDSRDDLRRKHNISNDDFVIGFVFRNQLRKSVPNLLDGFKLFLDKNPSSKIKLLLHTHWGEGWDITRLVKEKGIDPNLVLTTYYCDKCRNYEVKPFHGQNADCRFCGSKQSQQTVQITRGVSESQLNEIYNLMDVYCHPFTSGGQEIPIQEAKLCELITLVTKYSCGEDYCTDESGGLPLGWSEYREPGTQFIKASTNPEDILNQLTKVYEMKPNQREKLGKKARDFVIDFCSIDSVCSKFEKLISKIEKTDWNFDFSYVPQNESYVPPAIEDNRDWIIDLYKNILNVDAVNEDQNGITHWEHRLKTDLNRQAVYDYFVNIARQNNNKNNKISFEDLIDKEDDGKRILFVMPDNEIDIFNSTSLLKYIKDKYPKYNIYFATKPEFYDILHGNPYIHKVVPYDPVMDNFVWSEGQGTYNGLFNFVLMPSVNTNKTTNFVHGNEHKIEYDLNHA